MARIIVAPGLRRLCADQATLIVDCESVGAVLAVLRDQFPALRQLLDIEQGSPPAVRFFLNGLDVTGPECFGYAIRPTDQLVLFHPVAGG